jgi:hypothetical protein
MSAQPLVGGAFDDPGHAQPINVEPTKIPAFMAGPPSSAISNWNPPRKTGTYKSGGHHH